MISMDRMATLGLNQRLSRKNMAIELMIERRMAGALMVSKLTPNNLKKTSCKAWNGRLATAKPSILSDRSLVVLMASISDCVNPPGAYNAEVTTAPIYNSTSTI